jgi:hypothetical protein
MFLNSNTSLSIYFFCKSRTQVITLYSGYVCVILCINASVLAPRRSGTSQAVLPSLHCPSTCQHAPLSRPSLPLLIPMASCLCSLVARAGPDNGEGRCKRRAWTLKLSDEEKAWAFTPSVSEQLMSPKRSVFIGPLVSAPTLTAWGKAPEAFRPAASKHPEEGFGEPKAL